jgi:3-oxoacyl-[acyl-carrier protein] reductase
VDFGLKNKVAIVCGASKGMGFSCAQALALEGVKVLMIARNEIALAEATKKIKLQGGIVMALAGDVGDLNLAIAAVNNCEKVWGGVDILINNAGGPPMGNFQEHSSAAWNLAIQTNLMSVVNFCQAVTPRMINNKWGRLVHITSTVAKEPSPLMVLSATTRAGVAAFSKALAIELASFNISSNVICPGGVLTDRLADLLKAKAERNNKSYEDTLFESQQAIPAKRFANPREIADAILFLVSEQGGYINGVSLNIDGALTRGSN